MQPLDARSRRAALIMAAACLTVFAVLAVTANVVQDPLTGDVRVARVITEHPFLSSAFWNRVVELGEAAPLALCVLTVFAAALLLRDRFGALIALVGPPIAVFLSDGVGKPLIARHEGDVYGFPSGHSTSVTALCTVAALVVYRRWGLKTLWLASPALALLPCAMVVALIRLHHHLPSDAVGGVLLGSGTVLGLAGLLSLEFARRKTTRIA